MTSPFFSIKTYDSRLTNGHAGTAPLNPSLPNGVQVEVQSLVQTTPPNPLQSSAKKMNSDSHSREGMTASKTAPTGTGPPPDVDSPVSSNPPEEAVTDLDEESHPRQERPSGSRHNQDQQDLSDSRTGALSSDSDPLDLVGSNPRDLSGSKLQGASSSNPRHLSESDPQDLSSSNTGAMSSNPHSQDLGSSASGLLTYNTDPQDFVGGGSVGGGSRLKNRIGARAGVSAQYMPTIAEKAVEKADGVEVASGPSHSNTSSYSATYSTSVLGSAGSGLSSNGGQGAPGRDTLTVEGTWKVEAALKAKQGRRESGVRKLAVAKWVATVVMLLVLLACLVSVKLSLLTLCSQLWDNLPQQAEGEGPQWTPYSAQFIVLYLYLSVPPFLMWLRSVWYGLLDKLVPWPSRKAVLLTVMSAALESLGLCLLCYSVLGRYQTPVSLLLLTAVLVVPAFNMVPIVRAQRRRGRVRSYTGGLVMVGVVCLVLGTVGVGVVLAETATLDSDLWHLAVALFCLSVAWLPSLHRYICGTGRQQAARNREGNLPTDYGTFHNDLNNSSNIEEATTPLNTTASTGTTTTTATTTSDATNSLTESNESRNSRSGDLSSNAAWKTAFILNGLRVLFIFLFSCLLFILDSGQTPSEVLTDDVHQAFLDAWDLSTHVEGTSTWVAFWLGLGAALLAYVLAFAACHMNMAVGALAPPLLLAMPVSLVVVTVSPVCQTFLPSSTCSWEEEQVKYVVPAGLCLAVGHALVFGWYLFRVDPVLLLQECMVFFVPGYNGVTLDAWLTLNRRHEVSVTEAGGKKKRKKPKVYICTTMYREEEEEMRQLLDSIRLINEAQAQGDRHFESHIIFDNGVRQKELSEFALTLIALLQDTLGIEPGACTKVTTPYGLKLSWELPGPSGKRMAFNIHLKDNLLVKNKKRWSQVMYMSYVLDYLTEANDEVFILTTDADVVFNPDSVEALLDLMTRDNSIGAVCARTHPMGGGPLVWYQVFEYAIGHWFQKTAEHALGSVLCAPGCFSVYRCRALADVLPKYAKRVETAFDFLTKDMGEDRWLCTLLVQSGWRIEYCAASENSTNCPGNFDEFYKQRRRWIASTLANLMLIVKEWKYVLLLNHRVSVIFLMYQGLLLFSTLIGPSTVMLVVSGGLAYAWTVDSVATVVVQLLICVVFCAVCVYTTQPTQLMVAKIYTFLYAVVMTAVVVGTAAQIVDDLDKPTPGKETPGPSNGTITTTTTLSPNQHISVDLPMSVTTLYFLGLVVIFVTAGLLHPREMYCLAHGVWYLLCLPSGYLVLTLYSVCNITDSSWGTREQAAEKSAVKQAPWQERVKTIFFDIFFCCNQKKKETSTKDVGVQTAMPRSPSVTLSIPEEPAPSSLVGLDESNGASARKADIEVTQEELDEIPDETEPVPVEEWLPLEMKARYLQLFKKHGFDSTLFIAGMTETELRRIGVTSKGHLHYLLEQIAHIPAFEIEYKVPTNVDEWLEEIGLPMYRDNFRRNHIRQPKEMEVLKSFGRKEIEKELGVIKDGHIKRLKYAISMLRDPTEAQQKAIQMRQLIDEAPMHHLGEFNVGENDFWQTLKQKCLEPDLKAFGLEGEVKAKLAHLRNDWLIIVAVSNVLWLILITTLASNASLIILGANPMGFVFLTVFGFLFVVQFLTMLIHRLYTLSHFLARAPYRCGRPMQSTWTFMTGRPSRRDFEDTNDYTAVQQVKRDAQRAWHKVVKPKRKGKKARSKVEQGSQLPETSPLLREDGDQLAQTSPPL